VSLSETLTGLNSRINNLSVFIKRGPSIEFH